jgi:hypothetical protein
MDVGVQKKAELRTETGYCRMSAPSGGRWVSEARRAQATAQTCAMPWGLGVAAGRWQRARGREVDRQRRGQAGAASERVEAVTR